MINSNLYLYQHKPNKRWVWIPDLTFQLIRSTANSTSAVPAVSASWHPDWSRGGVRLATSCNESIWFIPKLRGRSLINPGSQPASFLIKASLSSANSLSHQHCSSLLPPVFSIWRWHCYSALSPATLHTFSLWATAHSIFLPLPFHKAPSIPVLVSRTISQLWNTDS